MYKLLSDEGNEKKFKIKTHSLHSYLKLDSSSFKALNLLPDRMEQSTLKTHSIYGLLNQCCTSQGQRLLMQWIKQPLVDINKLGMVLYFFGYFQIIIFLTKRKE